MKMRCCPNLLTELEAQSALLVTSAFHMQRSLAVFEKAMPGVNGFPTAPIYKRSARTLGH